jgi:hypothetical protein
MSASLDAILRQELEDVVTHEHAALKTAEAHLPDLLRHVSATIRFSPWPSFASTHRWRTIEERR